MYLFGLSGMSLIDWTVISSSLSPDTIAYPYSLFILSASSSPNSQRFHCNHFVHKFSHQFLFRQCISKLAFETQQQYLKFLRQCLSSLTDFLLVSSKNRIWWCYRSSSTMSSISIQPVTHFDRSSNWWNKSCNNIFTFASELYPEHSYRRFKYSVFPSIVFPAEWHLWLSCHSEV